MVKGLVCLVGVPSCLLAEIVEKLVNVSFAKEVSSQ